MRKVIFRIGYWFDADHFGSNGAIDSQFGNGGVVVTDFNTTHDLSLSSAMQPDGKLVLAGWTSGSLTFNPDLAIYRSVDGASSQWWIQKSSDSVTQSVEWGLPTDIPVAADFDGDQKTDIAVWRPAPATQATFYILNSSDNTLRQEAFGQSGDQPIVGDYDGDGKADVGVYRNGVWYILQSSNTNIRIENFGNSTDTPIPSIFVQ